MMTSALDPTSALQLAAKLEYLEAAFYAAGASAFASGAQAFTPGEASAVQQILKHENAHVTLLKSILGSNAPTQPASSAYDFTAGSGTKNGPFAAALTTKTEFFKVAQLLEDIGVRALKGQLSTLMTDKASLTTVMQLHQVEARHAGEIRRLRSQNAWISGASFDGGYTGSATTAGTQASVALKVYGASVTDPLTLSTSEDNRVQGAIPNQPSDSFDEPLAATDVMSFALLFGVT
jgi:hypothetical protein